MSKVIYAKERFPGYSDPENDPTPCDAGDFRKESIWSKTFWGAGPEYVNKEPGIFCYFLDRVDDFLNYIGN